MDTKSNPVEDAIVDELTGYFREGLQQFLAKGLRHEMIQASAAHCQKRDEPRQRELFKKHVANVETLARYDL